MKKCSVKCSQESRPSAISVELYKDIDFFNLLSGSYRRFIGQSLTPNELPVKDAAHWLYMEASFPVLAHNIDFDPVFIYGNKAAQNLFGYDWNELITLPSRLSAEPLERDSRAEFLEGVARDGYVTGYSGIRIAKSGRRFRIADATVWQLIDDEAGIWGQAAMLPSIIAL
jgi:hypothetical protein